MTTALNNGIKIPLDIIYDNALSDSCKIFYGKLLTICDNAGCCNENNKSLAAWCKTTPRTIQNRLTTLITKKYIQVKISNLSENENKRKIIILNNQHLNL